MLNTTPPPTFAVPGGMHGYPLTYMTGMHPSGLSQPGTQPGTPNLHSGLSTGMSALSNNPMQPNQQMMMARMLAQGGQH